MKSSKPQFVGQKVKLSDICSIVSGATPKTTVKDYWGGDIKWITPSELNDDSHVIYNTAKHLTEAGFASARLRMFPEGTVLLTTRAPIGKVAIAGEPMCCNQGFKNLVCSDAVNNEYLYRYLKNRSSELQVLGHGATFKELSKKEVAAYEINLPPLKRQLEAVEKLALVDKQVVIAKTQLDKLDSLVKSRFIEMFGDPVEENRWARITLASLCTKLGSGATPRGGKAAYKTSGIPLIRSMNVHNGYFESKDLAYIDEIQAKKLDNVTLHKGDVLLNITGASVARSCLLPDYLAGGRVNQHVSIVRCDPNRMLPRVLNSIFTSDSYQRFLLEHSRMAGATREAITKDDLETMTVPLPPLSLQYKFAAFVAQVDKSRFGGMLHLLNSLSGIMHASFFSVADTD